MRALILAAALALTALPASAATYSLTTTAGQELAITDARLKYNASLPAFLPDGTTPNPALIATNGGYLLFVLTGAITSYNVGATVHPPLPPADKANMITILNAAIAKADANSAAAQSLLNVVQATSQ